MRKRVLLIGTGGTIASDITSQGLKPSFDAKELVSSVPELKDLCDIECIQLYNVDSTNVSPIHWCGIVKTIRDNYDLYDGFVITYGTDTMAYTAAALSYLIQNTGKPIVLTGSQRPIGFDGSDAKTNLRDSFICACSDGLCGVMLVFDGDVISGTRAKKTHSKSLQAFESINFPCLARVNGGKVDRYIAHKPQGALKFYDQMNAEIGLVKMFPSIKRCQLENVLESCDGAVIESYGVGGLPLRTFDGILERAFSRGVTVVMTTQVESGGSDLSAYAVGRRLKGYPELIEAYDMTTEAAVTKLMWALSVSRDMNSVRRRFYTPVMFDVFPPKDCMI